MLKYCSINIKDGQAGHRQISNAKVGLCQVFGWNHVAAVSILKK